MNEIERKEGRLWPFATAIIFLILLVGGLFLYFATASPSKPKNTIENPISQNVSYKEAVLGFSEEYIDYLVFSIGGWKLHNPPASSETPKIKVIVDSDVYVSEIINGEIKTKRKEINNEDITIRTTREEIVNAILSSDMGNYIKQSVQEGKTVLELKADYTTLFSKGYLNIYKELTGKPFTGSVIEIFKQK